MVRLYPGPGQRQPPLPDQSCDYGLLRLSDTAWNLPPPDRRGRPLPAGSATRSPGHPGAVVAGIQLSTTLRHLLRWWTRTPTSRRVRLEHADRREPAEEFVRLPDALTWGRQGNKEVARAGNLHAGECPCLRQPRSRYRGQTHHLDSRRHRPVENERRRSSGQWPPVQGGRRGTLPDDHHPDGAAILPISRTNPGWRSTCPASMPTRTTPTTIDRCRPSSASRLAPLPGRRAKEHYPAGFKAANGYLDDYDARKGCSTRRFSAPTATPRFGYGQKSRSMDRPPTAWAPGPAAQARSPRGPDASVREP